MEKFLGMLGLCARAGKLVSGEDGVRIAVKKRQAYLVIVDAQSSANTLDRAKSMCAVGGAPLAELDADIGKAIGKEGRKLIAVTDKAFAKNLLNKINNLANDAE